MVSALRHWHSAPQRAKGKTGRSASVSPAKTERLDICVPEADNVPEIGHYFADLARSKFPALWLAGPFQKFDRTLRNWSEGPNVLN